MCVCIFEGGEGGLETVYWERWLMVNGSEIGYYGSREWVDGEC